MHLYPPSLVVDENTRLEIRNTACIIDDLELAAMAVGRGLGFGYLPVDLAERFGTVVEVEGHRPRKRTMNVVYPSRRLLSRRLRDLISHMSHVTPPPGFDLS